MRHNVFGRSLGRKKDEKRRLFRVQMRDLIKNSRIITTHAKAKALQPLAEKLVTASKKGTNAQINEIRKTLSDKESVKSLLRDAVDRFSQRKSGFTRVIKIGKRKGDATEMAMIEFVDPFVKIAKNDKSKPKKSKPAELKKLKAKTSKKKNAVKGIDFKNREKKEIKKASKI